ncbi:MAG: VOC family protein [Pseudomonadota bacterium]
MPTTGTLSHIDISAGYPEKSIPFYDALFLALGYKRWHFDSPEWQGPNPQRASWAMRQPGSGVFGVEVRPARKESRERKYDRYEPGPHHIAFNAESPAVVDAVYRAMLAVDAEVLDPPTEYGGQAGYGESYYAVFFADPDNMKLEVVYVPDSKPK